LLYRVDGGGIVRQGRASRTAEHNALFRALETSRPGGLFADPLAASFLSPSLRAVALLAHVPPAGAAVCRTIDRRWPGVRTSVVARTRLIDGVVAERAGGVGQVVVLGAGFDTRAHRLPALADRPVFEVDHPDTQRRKREVLRRRGVAGGHVRFVATDLERDDLDASLATAGHDRAVPALLLWEGVTNYLDAVAVEAGLRWCAGAAPGSTLVFTYVDRAVLVDPGRYVGADRLVATLRRTGEDLTFGMAPDEVPARLAGLGLALERDLGAAEYRALVYGDAARRVRGHEFYRVAVAGVPA
jgi:methyltransferase (TIGR00027 family)